MGGGSEVAAQPWRTDPFSKNSVQNGWQVPVSDSNQSAWRNVAEYRGEKNEQSGEPPVARHGSVTIYDIPTRERPEQVSGKWTGVSEAGMQILLGPQSPSDGPRVTGAARGADKLNESEPWYDYEVLARAADNDRFREGVYADKQPSAAGWESSSRSNGPSALPDRASQTEVSTSDDGRRASLPAPNHFPGTAPQSEKNRSSTVLPNQWESRDQRQPLRSRGLAGVQEYNSEEGQWTYFESSDSSQPISRQGPPPQPPVVSTFATFQSRPPLPYDHSAMRLDGRSTFGHNPEQSSLVPVGKRSSEAVPREFLNQYPAPNGAMYSACAGSPEPPTGPSQGRRHTQAPENHLANLHSRSGQSYAPMTSSEGQGHPQSVEHPDGSRWSKGAGWRGGGPVEAQAAGSARGLYSEQEWAFWRACQLQEEELQRHAAENGQGRIAKLGQAAIPHHWGPSPVLNNTANDLAIARALAEADALRPAPLPMPMGAYCGLTGRERAKGGVHRVSGLGDGVGRPAQGGVYYTSGSGNGVGGRVEGGSHHTPGLEHGPGGHGYSSGQDGVEKARQHLEANEEIETDGHLALVLGAQELGLGIDNMKVSEMEQEVRRRLGRMDSIPHTMRVNSGRLPHPDDLSRNHELLTERLLSFGLRERQIAGDGNCQFRALSDQLFGTPERHGQVRRDVKQQLKSQAEVYQAHVPENYLEYVKKMAKNGEWGDHITLQAAADVYRAKISLITSYQDKYLVEILPREGRPQRELWLSFWAEVHYNSIYAMEDFPKTEPKKKHWLF